MSRKMYTAVVATLIIAVGAVVGYSVKVGEPLIALAGVMAGILVMSLAKRKVSEVLEDERIHRIGDKSSRRALQAFSIIAIAIGLPMTFFERFATSGYTLLFSACMLTFLYLIFYAYYSRRPME